MDVSVGMTTLCAELAFLRGILEEGLYAASTQTTAMKPPDSITLGHPIHMDRSTLMCPAACGSSAIGSFL
jgi:hypothetical protein